MAVLNPDPNSVLHCSPIVSLKINLDKHVEGIKRWTLDKNAADMAPLYFFLALALSLANAVLSQQCAEPTAGAQVSLSLNQAHQNSHHPKITPFIFPRTRHAT